MENLKNKIMIVDDDRDFSEELKDMLSAASYEVTVTNESDNALELMKTVKPDILLLDLRMRPVSGFEVASKLKYLPDICDTPIIAMSGCYTIKEHEFLMNICNIKKFLEKPLDPEELLVEIENILKT